MDDPVMNWLVPAALFWLVGAVYFGGWEREVHGGSGPRQLLGLVLTYAIFLGVWGGVQMAVGRATVIGILVATAVAVVAIPLEARLGFLLVGAHLGRSAAH